jgi:hypothetical protein
VKKKRLFIFILLCATTHFPSRFLAPDALTAATSGAASAAFALSVLEGPNIRAGASLVAGQPVEWLLTVTNPWSNNTVSMAISNPQPGMTLTPSSTNQANPSWKLTWTPDGTVVGALSIQLKTTFTQSNGSTLYYNQPVINIKIQGADSQAAATVVKSVSIAKAVWNASAKALTVNGRITLTKGSSLPSGTVIGIEYSNGSALPSSSALISKITPQGTWASVIPLEPGTNPCAIRANIVVQGLSTSAVATRKVTGKATGCS